jgi:hypothetical protein
VTSERIAGVWRENGFLSLRWVAAPSQAGTLSNIPAEAGGLYMTCDFLNGRRAYVKPTKRSAPHHARAAREKIAADLAHDLGVRVPPVILARREDCGTDEEFVSASLVLYPRQFPWAEMRDFVPIDDEFGNILRDRIRNSASSAFAFDTWVGQPDHNDHPHNIVFGFEPGNTLASSFIYLDYAMALGWGELWKHGVPQVCDPAPFPPGMMQFLDTDRLSEIVAQIEAFDEDVLRDVVYRIPETHLVEEQKSLIFQGLRERRHLLRAALTPYLPGGL